MRYVGGASRALSLLALSASLFSGISGCTLKSQEQKNVIRIPLPDSRALARLSGAAPFMYSGSSPTSLASFTCYGLSVSGPGIVDDARLGCRDLTEAPPGRIGGLVSVTDGFIEMEVPQGPARHIRLFGVQSEIGCPKIDDILSADAVGESRFQGLDKPYLLGSAMVDLYGDAEVTIYASFDPAHPQPILEGCGDHGSGSTVPVASITKGQLNGSGSFPSNYYSSFMDSTTATLTSPVATTSAEMTAATTLEPDNGSGLPVASGSNSVLHSAQGDGGSVSSRAAIQVKWDVTSLNPAEYVAMDLQVQIGGGESGCSLPSTEVKAGVLRSDGTWSTSSAYTMPTTLKWSPFYQGNVANYFVTEGASKFVILNIESNALAQGAGCSSVIALGGVRLQLHKTPPPLQMDLNPYLPNYAPPAMVNLHAWGGVPPYSFSAIHGSISGPPGSESYFVPSGYPGDTITVTDSLGATTSYSFTISGYWSYAGNMSANRQNPTVTPLDNGKILVVGGPDAAAGTSGDLFDSATQTFSTTGSLIYGRGAHAATKLGDGKVLVTGGQLNFTSTFYNSGEIYDPTSNSFTPISSSWMSAKRAMHTSTLLPNGKVFIAGGADFTNGASPILASPTNLYDPSLNSFGTGPSIAPRRSHTATALPDGRVVLIGGYNDATSLYPLAIEIYDPWTNTISTSGMLPSGRMLHSATLLPDGRIVIVGGFYMNNASNEVLVYDPTLSTVSALTTLNQARRGHFAALLPSGKLLIAGGQEDQTSQYYLSSTEIYDPTGPGSTTFTGMLTNGRANFGGAVLPSGEVVVFGGYGSSGDLGSAEIFR